MQPGWLVAVAAWGGAALLVWPLVGPRSGPASVVPRRAGSVRVRAPVSALRYARPAALLAGAALAAASHVVAGALAGLLLWWLLPAVVARLDTTDATARREHLAAQLPVAAGLLSSCLAAGAPLGAALAVSAEAMPGPSGRLLAEAARTVSLGGGPQELAAVLASSDEPGWQAMAAAVVRSTRTGAPLADLLHEQADAAMRSWAATASVRARSVAVRTVLPLALCYLPAFLLLGVAPFVAGLLAGIDLP